ncbi:hypothetical protein GCM10017687_49620 [Streptomyces echinatus]
MTPGVTHQASTGRRRPDAVAAARTGLPGVRGRNPGCPVQPASVIEIFEQQAAKRPEEIAVRDARGELTYAELDHRANQLAHELRARGVDAEVPVALLMRRSADLIVTLVAVLKAGGVYLALDPRLPAERRTTVLLDARPALVVTDEEPPSATAGDPPWCLLAELSACASRRPTTPPVTRTSAESTAYIAYTSGSAGKPKGVMVPHRAIARLVVGADYLPIRADDVFLQLAPLAFDAATLEIWGPLLAAADWWSRRNTNSPWKHSPTWCAARVSRSCG